MIEASVAAQGDDAIFREHICSTYSGNIGAPEDLTNTPTDSEATRGSKLRRQNPPGGTCYMPMSYSHSGNRATIVTKDILTTHPSNVSGEHMADSEHFQPIYHIVASSFVGSCLSRLDGLAHLIAS